MHPNNIPLSLLHAAGVPQFNWALTASTSLVGAAAGAAAGAIAGPLGIAAGFLIGTFVGVLSGQTMKYSELLRERYVARLDREIGVFG
jgi:hypothetical protein